MQANHGQPAPRGQSGIQEERFRRLMDQAPFLCWASGPDASCIFFNQPWLEFRGRTLEQELGQGWLEGVHPDDRSECLSAYLRAFEARQLFRMEYRLRRADGEYRRVLDNGVPQYAEDDTFIGYLGACVDIDPRQTTAGPMPLTARERQVLTLIAEGRTTKQLATMLNISYKTADSHRTRIMEKLEIHETATLVRYAIRHGLIKP